MIDIELIEAPSNLGLKPPCPGVEPGTRRAPEALIHSGLAAMPGIQLHRRIEAPVYSPDESRPVNIRNLEKIAMYSRRLAAAIGTAVRNTRFPLVIGGDCSILIGVGLALSELGTYGLLFVDGHTDFFLPEQSATGGAAGMDLALVTGFGPDALTDIEGHKPYFRPENVLLLGNRDSDLRPTRAIPGPKQAGMDYWDLDSLRTHQTLPIVRTRIAALANRPVDGFWIHLDVDALEDSIMPAVDSRQPGGFSWDEMAGIVKTALASGRAVGMEITIFDPDRDSDGSLASVLCENIVHWFGV
ncbi:MAG: arginase family protein [Gammaproteobacteria bacterium]